jgi:uncharacterized protein YndB with AHSA1/START domain
MNVHFKGSIAKPIHLVFDAIVNHRKMCNYFISKGSGPMEEGKTVQWEWDNAGAMFDIAVKKVVPHSLVQFSWVATGGPSLVTIRLEEGAQQTTTITITEEGWAADESAPAKAVQQSIGWTDFFCSLKAYLLFSVNLRSGKALAPNKAFL